MANIEDFDNFKAEWAEEALDHYDKTTWPEPDVFNDDQIARWRLEFEQPNQAIEEIYYWILDNLKLEDKFPHFDKVVDVFTASEQSAFFGGAEQRLGLRRDRVSQYLATIGKMIKELFQLVRELRILDERLEYYVESNKGDLASEITLKGYWIDLVEGGAKNPASVYGMARELQFVTLPDIFFGTPPMPSAKVDEYVQKLSFNRKVKEVLSRKLKSYLVWKEHTHKEMKTRRVFTLKYLRQHYDIIKMYMAWVKPYLKNIKRMQMDLNKMDSADIVSAFEGSLIEIEFIARRPIKNGVHACLDCHFYYRSRPELKFVQEGYQRGPIHTGKTQMTLRAYSWTTEQLMAFKKFKEQEDFDLLASVDASVQAAYTAMGEELEKYLAEAGENMLSEYAQIKKKEEEEQHTKHILQNPLLSIFRGLGDMGKSFTFKPASARHGEEKCGKCHKKVDGHDPFCTHCGTPLRKLSKKEAFEIENARKEARKYLQEHLYTIVKRFKAAHGMYY